MKNISVDEIINETANYFNVKTEDIKGKSRLHHIVRIRHIAIYIVSVLTNYSTNGIAKEFGNRDHTTVMYAIANVKEKMCADLAMNKTILMLSEKIKGNE